MAITVPVASKKKKNKKKNNNNNNEDLIMENELPVGFRFNPTDDELVTHFLRNRNLGKPTPSNAVKECDLYGKKEPWEIWDMFSAVDGSRVVRQLYFFTKLKTYKNGRRIDRSGRNGYRFDPTDEELVTNYLRKRNMGKPIPLNPVKDCDLYGKKEPWEIWDMFSAGDTVVKQLYFFTKLKTYDNGTRFDRRVGSGSWGKDKLCKSPLKGIEKSRFGYENNDNSSSKQNGNWILYEYKDLNPPNQDSNEYVLCRSTVI
ncbi:NAC domain-containing protein 41 [Quercus suber]|uniref:NAC domain-containing protein 41 n=1 Tax=Quercus suber TaxID=58331 RepID=UPI0032DE603A